MKLVPAEGSWQLQSALKHAYVHTIVDIFIQFPDTLLATANILQTYVQRAQPGLQEQLEALRQIYQTIDSEGTALIPQHIITLTETLNNFYRQNNETIEYQRGAIIELLGRKLICPRYSKNDFCSNSRRFVDERNRKITLQEVDVAALSHVRLHVEAYECKMRVNKLMNDDCRDLSDVFDVSQGLGYQANVGVVSFDTDRVVRKKLQRLDAPNCIGAYGLENIGRLHDSPFE